MVVTTINRLKIISAIFSCNWSCIKTKQKKSEQWNCLHNLSLNLVPDLSLPRYPREYLGETSASLLQTLAPCAAPLGTHKHTHCLIWPWYRLIFKALLSKQANLLSLSLTEHCQVFNVKSSTALDCLEFISPSSRLASPTGSMWKIGDVWWEYIVKHSFAVRV